MTEPTREELLARITQLQNALATKDDELLRAWSRWEMANAISISTQNALADIRMAQYLSAPKQIEALGLKPITAWYRLVPTENGSTVCSRDYNHFEYGHVDDLFPSLNGKVQYGKWDKVHKFITVDNIITGDNQ